MGGGRGRESAAASEASSRSSWVCECPTCRVFLISVQKLLAALMADAIWEMGSDISYLSLFSLLRREPFEFPLSIEA